MTEIDLSSKKYKAFVLPAEQTSPKDDTYVSCYIPFCGGDESLRFYAKPLTCVPKYEELGEYVDGPLELVPVSRGVKESTGYDTIYINEEGKFRKGAIINTDATAFSVLCLSLLCGGDVIVGNAVFVRENPNPIPKATPRGRKKQRN